MKRIKTIRHRIEQKTALRKHNRQRRRYFFRFKNKALVRPVETIDESQVRAKEQLFGKPSTKKENPYGPKKS